MRLNGYCRFSIVSCANLFLWVGKLVFLIGNNVVNCCSLIKDLDVALLLPKVEEIGLVLFLNFLAALMPLG